MLLWWQGHSRQGSPFQHRSDDGGQSIQGSGNHQTVDSALMHLLSMGCKAVELALQKVFAMEKTTRLLHLFASWRLSSVIPLLREANAQNEDLESIKHTFNSDIIFPLNYVSHLIFSLIRH